jgi:hypothetical protein
MQGLTEREAVLFNALKRSKKKGASTLDLIEALRTAKIKMPKTQRHTMTLNLKYLAYKVSPHGYIIRRISGGQGRGNIAVYEMTREF